MSNDHPIVDAAGPEILYCARCGAACTRVEAIYRRFNTGFSACCNENLLAVGPAIGKYEPKQYTPRVITRVMDDGIKTKDGAA